MKIGGTTKDIGAERKRLRTVELTLLKAAIASAAKKAAFTKYVKVRELYEAYGEFLDSTPAKTLVPEDFDLEDLVLSPPRFGRALRELDYQGDKINGIRVIRKLVLR